MGFWSKLAKVGKIALPAVLAATGVGIPAAAAVMAGTGIAEKKIKGGSWSDSLKSGALEGGISAATGGLSGAAGAAKGGFGAALKTGLKSALTNPDVLGGIGATLGGMSDAAAANRGEREKMNIQRDQIELIGNRDAENAHQNRADLELKTQEADRTTQSDAYKKALKSALALNTKDVHMNRPAGVPVMEFGGGSRPSAIGEQGRQAAEILNNQAMQKLLNGETHTALPAVKQFEQSKVPEQSVWEKIAGPAALGTSTLAEILRRRGIGESAHAEDVVETPLTAQNPKIYQNVRF